MKIVEDLFTIERDDGKNSNEFVIIKYNIYVLNNHNLKRQLSWGIISSTSMDWEIWIHGCVIFKWFFLVNVAKKN